MKYFVKCLRNYFNIKGRARRKEFWYFVLYSFFLIVLWNLIWLSGYYLIDHDRLDQFLKMNNGGGMIIVGLGYTSLYLFLTFPFASVCSRRFNDIGIKLEDYEKRSVSMSFFWSFVFILIYMFCMAWVSDIESSIGCASIIIPVIVCLIVYSRGIFIKGTEGDNPYGPDPRINDPYKKDNWANKTDSKDSEWDSSSDTDSDPFTFRR